MPDDDRSITKSEAVQAELDTTNDASEQPEADFKQLEAKVLMKLDIYIAPLLGLFNFIVCPLMLFSSCWKEVYNRVCLGEYLSDELLGFEIVLH